MWAQKNLESHREYRPTEIKKKNGSTGDYVEKGGVINFESCSETYPSKKRHMNSNNLG